VRAVSQVLPLSRYNFGVNLQWQPLDEWYGMLGASAGNAQAGQAPWTDFSWDTYSVLGEFGYAPNNLLGLGPGVYRIQPFVARADGPTQGGLCFDLQQQLGEHAPFGWFGRFGFGGSDVTAGASAQVGTGFIMKGPLKYAGLFPGREQDAAGIGFVWSQPSATSAPVAHESEYVLEAGYVLQLTSLMKLQPDLQVVWNPAYNPGAPQRPRLSSLTWPGEMKTNFLKATRFPWERGLQSAGSCVCWRSYGLKSALRMAFGDKPYSRRQTRGKTISNSWQMSLNRNRTVIQLPRPRPSVFEV
jgi:hypothetical protein